MSFSRIESGFLMIVVLVKIILSWNKFYHDVMKFGEAYGDIDMLEYDLARTEEQFKMQNQVI